MLATGFHVSLSHHRAWRAVAVSADGPVGVDVLTVPDDADFIDDTALVLSPEEIAWVRSHARAQHGAAFAECWTRKEAYAKLHRTGLIAGLPTLTFRPYPVADRDVAFWTTRVEDAFVAMAAAGALMPPVRLHRRADSLVV